LPGDAELSAFSVANFFAGLIVGYHWLRLFGTKTQPDPKKED
jgi:cobalt/nickel transport protein